MKFKPNKYKTVWGVFSRQNHWYGDIKLYPTEDEFTFEADPDVMFSADMLKTIIKKIDELNNG